MMIGFVFTYIGKRMAATIAEIKGGMNEDTAIPSPLIGFANACTTYVTTINATRIFT